MTYRVLFLLSVLIAASSAALAQPRNGGGPPTSIRGIIVDEATGDPLRVATVSVWNVSDSSLATGTLSEKDGSFEIAGIRPGRYYVKLAYLGYKPRIIDNVTISPRNLKADLGKVGMQQDQVQGKEVVVQGRREAMTIEIDRTVYKAAELPVAAGGTATDVLRNIPAIEVDIDGNVALRGNQNVAILINGRPVVLTGDALSNFLQSLPSNSVERVEVIPNPSAKYDPDGMSGIINIVLKQEGSRGLSGGVNAAVGTRDNYSAGGNLAWGSGPWSIMANYGFNAMNRDVTGFRYQENRLVEPHRLLEQNSISTWNNVSHSLTGGVDYYFTPISSLSLSAVVNFRGGDDNDRSDYTSMDALRNVTGRSQLVGLGESDDRSMDYRLEYKWAPQPSRHELSAELRFNDHNDNENTTQTQQELELDGRPSASAPFRQRIDQSDRDREYTGQIDYTLPIGEHARLETGYKGERESIGVGYSPSRYDSTAAEFVRDPLLEDNFDYTRTIHAVYGNYGQEFGPFSAQVGVRAEQAYTDFDQKITGGSYSNDYFSVFPSAFLVFKPNDALQFKASYSKRINRPRTWSLNPMRHENDPTFRQVGNPYLKPEYIHAFEFGVTHFTDLTTLTLTPFFRRTVDAIERNGTIDSNGITTSTFVNQATNDEYGADLIGSVRLGEAFSAFASLSAYHVQGDASNVEQGMVNEGYTWSARVNGTVQIIKGLDLQATWFYRAASPIINGEAGSHSMSDVSLQYRFLDNQARIGTRVRDVFNTAGFGMWRDDASAHFEFSRKPNARTVFLTFSYTFGSQDRTRRQQRQDQPQNGGEEEGGW